MLLLLLVLVSLDQVSSVLGNAIIHVGAIFFALEDFNRKKLKRFVEPLTYTSQLSK